MPDNRPDPCVSGACVRLRRGPRSAGHGEAADPGDVPPRGAGPRLQQQHQLHQDALWLRLVRGPQEDEGQAAVKVISPGELQLKFYF